MSNRNQPRYNRCDWCGRDAHKLAVRSHDGTVTGICAQCWEGRLGRGSGLAARVTPDKIIYDRRTRKQPIFLGMSGKYGDADRQPLFADYADLHADEA